MNYIIPQELHDDEGEAMSDLIQKAIALPKNIDKTEPSTEVKELVPQLEALAAELRISEERLDDLARELVEVHWPNGTTKEQDAIFDKEVRVTKGILHNVLLAPQRAPTPYVNYFKNAVCFTCEGESGLPPTRTIDICERCYGEDEGEQPASPAPPPDGICPTCKGGPGYVIGSIDESKVLRDHSDTEWEYPIESVASTTVCTPASPTPTPDWVEREIQDSVAPGTYAPEELAPQGDVERADQVLEHSCRKCEEMSERLIREFEQDRIEFGKGVLVKVVENCDSEGYIHRSEVSALKDKLPEMAKERSDAS